MENQDNSPILDDLLSEDAAASASTSSETSHRLSAARQYAAAQYEKIRQATATQLSDVRRYTSTAREHINEQWDETCVKAKELHHAGEEYVKANPTNSMLGALGLGVIIGLILGRKN